ncbi:MAG: hypothetical protein AABY22_01720 [Nanoarchaeota archaeon]
METINLNLNNKTNIDNNGVYEMELSQSQADRLMRLRKIFIDKSPIIVNRPFNHKRDLVSLENQDDKFYLNVSQIAIDFGKYSTQTRFFTIPLVRICIDEDARHENPDGAIIIGSHIHIYTEGFKDTIAYPINDYNFEVEDIAKLLDKFLKYCNIESIKIIDQTTI